jgi:3-hydroxyacyl-[acyl-carrier protein] dehydratase/trans-2-decenoyl-[acyl-carrier protein] isomerase
LGAGEIDFFGQISPFDKLVRYELDIRRFQILKNTGAAISVANGRVFVDGVQIYSVQNAKVGVFREIAYDDYPNPKSQFARGGILKRD